MAGFALPIIGAAGSIINGIIGSNAAKGAGKTLANAGNQASNNIQNEVQTDKGFVSGATSTGQGGIDAAKNQANDVLKSTNDTEQKNLNPYLQAGTQGVTAFSNAIAPGGSLTAQFAAPTAAEAAATPGYQFQLDQGNQAIARSAAAGGTLGSGGTAKALDQYSQGLASTYYQNAYNNALTGFQTNRNNNFQDLTALTGVGMQASGLSNQANQNYGNMTSANTTGAASGVANMGLQGAEFNSGIGLQGTIASTNDYLQGQQGYASGQVGAGNAWSNAINGITGAAGAAFTPRPNGYGMPSSGPNPYLTPPTTMSDGSLMYKTSGTGPGPQMPTYTPPSYMPAAVPNSPAMPYTQPTYNRPPISPTMQYGYTGYTH